MVRADAPGRPCEPAAPQQCRAGSGLYDSVMWSCVVQVLAMLRGDELLPWEGERGTESLASLGALKGPVLQLLQRDPGQRASVRRFHLACSRVFASHVTIPTSTPPPPPFCHDPVAVHS